MKTIIGFIIIHKTIGPLYVHRRKRAPYQRYLDQLYGKPVTVFKSRSQARYALMRQDKYIAGMREEFRGFYPHSRDCKIYAVEKENDKHGN